MLRCTSARASSTSPVLSETESSARRMGTEAGFTPTGLKASRAGKSELLQLLAQCAAVDPQDHGGAALVAFRIVEHDAKQRLFHLAQHQVVQVRRAVPVQAGEVIAERALGVIAQRQVAPVQAGAGLT